MQAYRAKEQGFADVNPHLTPAQGEEMFADISM
jgi:hypothetical protein